jgi:4-aminobutyrate aminotransferase-like enzyme
VPDMVSLGKPMGNGYPVAGLVLTPDLAAAFGTNARYFNTFGGNAVAAATANAVLSVIEDEGLMQNARRVGQAFADGLREMATRHSELGPIRAAGLFLGAEIVRDGDPMSPDAALTARVVNHLRDNGVLISSTGPRANVLKIRPPLVFSTQNVGYFLERLEAALTA